MSKAGGIRAGAAYVELFVKDALMVKGLQKASAKLDAFGKSVSKIGKDMIALGAAMSVPFIAGVNEFANFEEKMTRISTLLDDPESFVSGFADGIRKLSTETGKATDEIADALFDILDAGTAPADAMKILEESVMGAVAGMSETKTVAQGLLTVMRAYGISATDAGKASDWLYQVVKSGRTSFEELSPVIGEAATMAKEAGLSLNDLGAAIAVMTKNGMKTTQAMSGINMIIQGFLKPAGQAAEIAKLFGVEMNSSTLKTRGLAGAFEELQKLPPDVLMKIFPSMGQMKAILPIISQLTDFRAEMGLMEKSAGAVDVAYDKMMNTLSAQFRKIIQNGKLMLSIIGEALQPVILKIGKAIETVAKSVGLFLQKNKELIVSAAGVVAGIIATGAALIAMGVAAMGVGAILAGLATVVTAIAGAFSALGALFVWIVTPAGALITALAGIAGYLIYTNKVGQQALSFLEDRFNSLKQTATSSFQVIKDALAAGEYKAAAVVLWTALKLEFAKGTQGIKELWIDVKEFLAVAWQEGLYRVLAASNKIFGSIAEVWNNTLASMRMTLEYFITNSKSLWMELNHAVERYFTDFIARQENTERKLIEMNKRLFGRRKYDSKSEINIVEETNKDVREKQEREQRALWGDYEKKMDDIEQARVDKNKEITDDVKSSADAIEQTREQEVGKVYDRFAGEKKRIQAELDASVAEWERAKEAARAATEAAKKPPEETPTDEIPTEPVIDAVGKIKTDFTSIIDSLESNINEVKESTAGAFSVAALQSLEAGIIQSRTANASEQTARNTEQIVKLLKAQNEEQDLYE